MAEAPAAASTEKGFAAVRDNGAPNEQVDEINYGPLLEGLRKEYSTCKTKDLAWRRAQLKNIIKMVHENYEAMRDAVLADHSGPRLRGIVDVLGTLEEAKKCLKNLNKWAKPKQVSSKMPGQRSEIRYEPKGIVLIIAPWNYPIDLTLRPLLSAIAAGNCVVVKPSEVSSNCEAVLKRLIPQYLDSSCIQVVTGGVAETTALLAQQWDHIFYTGNGFVGKIVMKAAANFLTPVTLELGGKSPTIIDKSANLDQAVERISTAKFINAGQTCIAPDYILVHEDVKDELVKKFKAHVRMMYGKNPQLSKHYGRIIAPQHVDRVEQLIKSSKAKVAFGGAVDKDDRYIAPTMLVGTETSEPIMREEIFGPVLPLRPVASMDEAISVVNSVCDRPLALYIFAQDPAVVEKVLLHCQSGSACVNSAFEQIDNTELPFGGLGASGTGAYHGHYGFLEFSHQRSTMHVGNRAFLSWMTGSSAMLPNPPYMIMGKDLHDIMVQQEITGFLTDGQRTALKAGSVAALAGAAFGAYKLFFGSKL